MSRPRFKFWLWAMGPWLVFWGCLACTTICLQLALESRQDQGQLLLSSGLSAASGIPAFVLGTHHPHAISWEQPKSCLWITTTGSLACHCHLNSAPRWGEGTVLVLKVALCQASFAKSAPTRLWLTIKPYSVLTKALAWVIWSCLFHATPGLESPQCEG